MYFKAQWRPFARENNRSALDEKHWWDLGAPAEGSVQLIADIFHVSGLHPAEDGTEHWFTDLRVSWFDRRQGDVAPAGSLRFRLGTRPWFTDTLC